MSSTKRARSWCLARVQAAAETYIGLVEVGVGLIPAGGGTKELTKRISDNFATGDVELNDMQNTFMNIATAKVATSAYEAFDMNILQKGDGISVSKNRQIADAKAAVLELSSAGYVKPVQAKNIRVQAIADHGDTPAWLFFIQPFFNDIKHRPERLALELYFDIEFFCQSVTNISGFYGKMIFAR